MANSFLFETLVFYRLGACVSAALLGLFSVILYTRIKKSRTIKQRMHNFALGREKDAMQPQQKEGLSSKLVSFIAAQSKIIALKPHARYFIGTIWMLGIKPVPRLIQQAGRAKNLTIEGYCHARALCLLAGLSIGMVIGVVFSFEAAVFAAVGGAVLGGRLPRWALSQTVHERKVDLENHLSEMLEVVALGLRSGLSFDRSYELYHQHFDTKLSAEAAYTQQQWQWGLLTREEALRNLSATYDSAMFSRVTENIIRSIRFGASLSDSMSASALEARLLNKSNREEEVAKAPIKMLVPTAALILPAMLILVLGPVMLEMMQGF